MESNQQPKVFFKLTRWEIIIMRLYNVFILPIRMKIFRYKLKKLKQRTFYMHGLLKHKQQEAIKDMKNKLNINIWSKCMTNEQKFIFRDYCIPKITLLERFFLLFYKEKRSMVERFDKGNKVFIYKIMRGRYYFLREEFLKSKEYEVNEEYLGVYK